jgi:hypothetical protein
MRHESASPTLPDLSPSRGFVREDLTMMRRLTVVLFGLAMMAACDAEDGGAKPALPRDSGVLTVTALRDLTVSANPLGDTGITTLGEGDSGLAECFVVSATTNTGAKGSAVRITVGGDTGFAPVAIRDPRSGEQVAFLKEDEDWLRSRLPVC